MIVEKLITHRGRLALVLVALAALLGLIAANPPAADAQACTQYDCPDQGGGGDNDPGGFGPGGGTAGTGGDGSGSGELPFTGYPLTPLILLLLLLLLIGLAIRTYLAVRDRLRAHGALAGTPTSD